MDRLKALMRFADRFNPEAVELANRRLYRGFRFFKAHKLRADLDPGTVRLALDIIKEFRPEEVLYPEEKKLLAKLDPRAFHE